MPTRVARYVQENGASCGLRFLEGLHRAGCLLMSVGGLGVAVYAAIALQQTANPPPSDSLTVHSAPPIPTEVGYAVIVAGGTTVSAIGLLGMLASGRRSLGLMNLHIVALSLIVAAQLCLGIYIWAQANPGLDSTAVIHTASTQMEQSQSTLVSTDEPDYQLAMLILLAIGMGSQVLTLVVACCLQSAYSQLDEAAQDREEEEGTRRPLLPPTLPTVPALSRPGGRPRNIPEDPAAAEWRARMQERYGIDTRQFTYDPSGRQDLPPELGPAPARQSGSRCTIM